MQPPYTSNHQPVSVTSHPSQTPQRCVMRVVWVDIGFRCLNTSTAGGDHQAQSQTDSVMSNEVLVVSSHSMLRFLMCSKLVVYRSRSDDLVFSYLSYDKSKIAVDSCMQPSAFDFSSHATFIVPAAPRYSGTTRMAARRCLLVGRCALSDHRYQGM